MTQSELTNIISTEISSNLKDCKKYFDVKREAISRCNEYISQNSDKNAPGFTDIVDFEMETLYYSAIEEAVKSTINVLAKLGVVQVDD